MNREITFFEKDCFFDCDPYRVSTNDSAETTQCHNENISSASDFDDDDDYDDDDDLNPDLSPSCFSAIDAVIEGDGATLGRYIRETKQLDHRILEALELLLNPSSTYHWKLEVQFRRKGRPTKKAKELKLVVTNALSPLANQIAQSGTIDARTRQKLATMLNPHSDHTLSLSFERRPKQRGRPRIQTKRLQKVPNDLRLNDEGIGALIRKEASRKNLKLIEYELQDQMSRRTLYRRRKELGITRRAKKS